MSSADLRVAILDGTELFRRGLALLLDTVPGIDVVASAPAAITGADRVDVVLVDSEAPGAVACAELQSVHPALHVLMLIAPGADADLYAALGAGVSGFLHKDAGLDELVEGIRVVADGQSLISPAVAATLVDGFGEESRGGVATRALTLRETDVLRLVALGLSNRAIGQQLRISEFTVKNHVRNLLDKLGLRTRTEAAMYAVREHIVEP